jgi:hypothetical protein
MTVFRRHTFSKVATCTLCRTWDYGNGTAQSLRLSTHVTGGGGELSLIRNTFQLFISMFVQHSAVYLLGRISFPHTVSYHLCHLIFISKKLRHSHTFLPVSEDLQTWGILTIILVCTGRMIVFNYVLFSLYWHECNFVL